MAEAPHCNKKKVRQYRMGIGYWAMLHMFLFYIYMEMMCLWQGGVLLSSGLWWWINLGGKDVSRAEWGCCGGDVAACGRYDRCVGRARG